MEKREISSRGPYTTAVIGRFGTENISRMGFGETADEIRKRTPLFTNDASIELVHHIRSHKLLYHNFIGSFEIPITNQWKLANTSSLQRARNLHENVADSETNGRSKRKPFQRGRTMNRRSRHDQKVV